MFGKVKRFLGIEGVKVEIVVPDQVSMRAGELSGFIRFFSMNDQTVTRIQVKLVEKYFRGRRKNKLINEFSIGEIEFNEPIEVRADEEVEIPFSLTFNPIKSEMDQMEEKNFVYGGLVKAAKMLKGVKSQFRLEVEAKVKGTALNPISKATLNMKA